MIRQWLDMIILMRTLLHFERDGLEIRNEFNRGFG